MVIGRPIIKDKVIASVDYGSEAYRAVSWSVKKRVRHVDEVMSFGSFFLVKSWLTILKELISNKDEY